MKYLDKKLIGYALLVLSGFFVTAEYLINQIVFNKVDIYLFGFWHFFSIAIFLTPICFYHFGKKKIKVEFLENKKLITIASVLIGLTGIFWFYLIQKYGSVFTSIMGQIEILFSLILGYIFLNEKLNHFEKFGIGLCLIGPIIINLEGFQIDFMAIWISILCFSMGAIYSFMIKKYFYKLSSLLITLYRVWIISLMYLVVLLWQGNLVIPEFELLAIAFINGLIGITGFGYLFVEAHKYLPISILNSFTAILPIMVMLTALVFLKEIPDLKSIIGSIIVVLGTLLIVLYRQREELQKPFME